MSDAPQETDASAAAESYVVVARRYRPQTFDELIGQQHIAQALSGAISSNRVGHAYLFTGARGVGKTSAARILAKALSCVDGPSPTPCNACDICQSVSAGDDIDVLEIDGASNRGIDEIRQLRSNVNVRPSRARYKIYIIDEVHMLTREAFNALLKTLEEPPEHVKFIFCTTEPNKIPITVLSRCQRFDFAGIDAPSIVERLAQIVESEGMSADRDALAVLARRAAGSMRDSQSLLEQLFACGPEHISVADVHTMLGTADNARLIALATHVAQNDAPTALAELDRALSEGVDVGQLLEQLLGIYRDVMVALAGCDDDSMLNAVSTEECEAVREIGQFLGLETTLAVMQILQKTLADLRYTTHRRTVAEVAVIRMCKLEGLEALSDLVASLREGSGPAMPTAASPASRRSGPVQKKSEPAAPVPIRKDASAPSPPSAGSVDEPGGRGSTRAASSTSPPPKKSLPPQESTPPPVPPPSPTSHPQSARPLTEQNVKQLWAEALAKLPDTVAARAGECEKLSVPEPNRLVVNFHETYKACKASLERPDQVAQIEAALEEVTGMCVQVVFALTETTEDKAQESRPVSRHQRLAAANKNPMVRRAAELFGARTVDAGQR